MNSCRLSLCCLPVMLACLAWSGVAHASSAQVLSAHVSSAHVYLLRGIFNVSVGLDALAGKLRGIGIAATVYGHDEEGMVAADALQQYQAGGARPIILAVIR